MSLPSNDRAFLTVYDNVKDSITLDSQIDFKACLQVCSGIYHSNGYCGDPWGHQTGLASRNRFSHISQLTLSGQGSFSLLSSSCIVLV